MGKRGRTGMHGNHRARPTLARGTLICAHCGKASHKYLQSFLDCHPLLRFCSHKCYSADCQDKHNVLNCEQCGRSFKTTPGRVVNGRKFCSHACGSTSRRVATPRWRSKVEGAEATDEQRAIFRAYHTQWRLRNKERVNAVAARSRVRRKKSIGELAIIRRGANTARRMSRLQLREIVERANGRCVYCDQSARLQIDHLIPIARGGTTVPENLIPACWPCNGGKSDSDAAVWLLDRHGPAGIARLTAFLAPQLAHLLDFDRCL